MAAPETGPPARSARHDSSPTECPVVSDRIAIGFGTGISERFCLYDKNSHEFRSLPGLGVASALPSSQQMQTTVCIARRGEPVMERQFSKNLSTSSIDVWRQCPRRFACSQGLVEVSPVLVAASKQHQSYEQVLGTVVHRVLESLIKVEPQQRTPERIQRTIEWTVTRIIHRYEARQDQAFDRRGRDVGRLAEARSTASAGRRDPQAAHPCRRASEPQPKLGGGARVQP